MRKALEIIGLPVVNSTTGEEFGKVKDLLFNDEWTFEGFLLEMNNWFKRGKYIPSSVEHVIGEDAVMIEEPEIHSLERSSQLFGLLTGTPKIKGISVLTENGHQLGQIEDVYLLEKKGILVGYELSDGLLSDLREGRKMLKRPPEVTLGEDALIVPVTSLEDVGEIVQGVSKHDTLSEL